MSFASRFTLCFVLLFAFSAIGFAQNDPEAAAAVGSGIPDYGTKSIVDMTKVAGIPSVSSSMVFDATTGAVIGGPSGSAGLNNSAPAAQTANDGRRASLRGLRPKTI